MVALDTFIKPTYLLDGIVSLRAGFFMSKNRIFGRYMVYNCRFYRDGRLNIEELDTAGALCWVGMIFCL